MLSFTEYEFFMGRMPVRTIDFVLPKLVPQVKRIRKSNQLFVEKMTHSVRGRARVTSDEEGVLRRG